MLAEGQQSLFFCIRAILTATSADSAFPFGGYGCWRTIFCGMMTRTFNCMLPVQNESWMRSRVWMRRGFWFSSGWIFYDWVQSYGKAFSFSGRQEQWTNGAPDVYSRQGTGVGSLLNWHYVGTLKIMERLEKAAGRLDEATGYAELALRISKRCIEKFYHATARLFADDETHSRYSVHSQLMAILSGTLDDTFSAQLYEAMKTTDIPLAQCTIYFSFYLFEVMKKYFDVPSWNMLTYWQHLPDLGFSTTPERPEPSRSDCHAWGTHPYYDVMTFLGGISPCAYGGKEFAIRLPNRLPDGFSATIPLLVGDYKVCVRKGMVELTIPELGNFYYKEEKLAPGIVRIRQTF